MTLIHDYLALETKIITTIRDKMINMSIILSLIDDNREIIDS
jgi:hypothetical protein